MRRTIVLVLALVGMAACSSKKGYDPAQYYSAEEQQKLLSRIVAYIYTTPPYTAKQDRFKPEHQTFYDSAARRFSLDQLFVDEKGTHFYLVVRPGPHKGEFRGAGGHFTVEDGMKLSSFREDFVTPIYSKDEVLEKSHFLFDQLAQHKLEPYLEMASYVQWPNAASTYDTINYEWTLVIPD